MEKIVTANTAAPAVGMTEASEKLVATTTVHFGHSPAVRMYLHCKIWPFLQHTSKNTSWATNGWIEWTEYVLQQGVDPEDGLVP